MRIKTVVVALSLVLLTSCRTSDQVTYFQDLAQSTSGQLTEQDDLRYETKICPDNQLSIFVSSIDPNSVAVFNLPLTSYLSPGETYVSATPTIQTYLVDANGYIDFPVLGKIKAAGYTRSELAEILKEKISAYVKSPLVTIKIERTNVLLIRDKNGKKEYQRLDLTSSEIFTSPYYYLQQNDIIYVEPNKARIGNASYSQSAQFNISVASTIVSAISVLASLTIALLVK